MRKNFKKTLLTAGLFTVMAFALTACGSKNENTAGSEAAKPEKVTVTDLDGTQVEVPYDAQRIAVLDYASLDIIDGLELGDRVVALPKSSYVSYLEEYVKNDNIVDTGSVKEVNYEALMQAEPDLIIVGGRLSGSIEELSKYAPTILVKSDEEGIGYMESLNKNVNSIASIFGKESKADELLNGFQARIDSMKAQTADKTALVGLTTGGSLSLYGSGQRFSIICNEIGFTNLKSDDASASGSSHGDTASFEVVVDKNPDYVFIVDRDAVVGGQSNAAQVMDNALIHQTSAYQNNQIVYLTGDVWYLASGGIKATDLMISEVEKAIAK